MNTLGPWPLLGFKLDCKDLSERKLKKHLSQVHKLF